MLERGLGGWKGGREVRRREECGRRQVEYSLVGRHGTEQRPQCDLAGPVAGKGDSLGRGRGLLSETWQESRLGPGWELGTVSGTEQSLTETSLASSDV